jgi:hypothetical protein
MPDDSGMRVRPSQIFELSKRFDSLVIRMEQLEERMANLQLKLVQDKVEETRVKGVDEKALEIRFNKIDRWLLTITILVATGNLPLVKMLVTAALAGIH